MAMVFLGADTVTCGANAHSVPAVLPLRCCLPSGLSRMRSRSCASLLLVGACVCALAAAVSAQVEATSSNPQGCEWAVAGLLA
jgi:hypothetical protein